MKTFRWFIMLPLVCLVLFPACNKDDDGPTGPDSNLNAETYMPLKIGAWWELDYASTMMGELFSYTSTETVSGTVTINNKSYYVMTNSGGDSIFIRIASNVIYNYDPFELTELPVFNFNKGPGESWVLFTESSPAGYMTGTGKYIGLEEVTVPAGTFADCAKFETRYEAVIYAQAGGAADSMQAVGYSWFAPDVGLVKSTEEDFINHQVIYTNLEELLNYSIPQ